MVCYIKKRFYANESANECSDYHYNIVIIFIMISFIVGLQFYAMVTLL